MKSFTNLDKANIVKEITDTFKQLIAAINVKDAAAWEKYYSKEEFASAIAGGNFFATRSNWVQAITSHFSKRNRQHVDLGLGHRFGHPAINCRAIVCRPDGAFTVL